MAETPFYPKSDFYRKSLLIVVLISAVGTALSFVALVLHLSGIPINFDVLDVRFLALFPIYLALIPLFQRFLRYRMNTRRKDNDS
jgi:hypothetical protein